MPSASAPSGPFTSPWFWRIHIAKRAFSLSSSCVRNRWRLRYAVRSAIVFDGDGPTASMPSRWCAWSRLRRSRARHASMNRWVMTARRAAGKVPRSGSNQSALPRGTVSDSWTMSSAASEEAPSLSACTYRDRTNWCSSCESVSSRRCGLTAVCASGLGFMAEPPEVYSACRDPLAKKPRKRFLAGSSREDPAVVLGGRGDVPPRRRCGDGAKHLDPILGLHAREGLAQGLRGIVVEPTFLDDLRENCFGLLTRLLLLGRGLGDHRIV